ncbi:type VI secretion system Vgr family protein [Desulfonatronum thioautotrophicum]|uniref:type VI secretion system Vgr family protein n=1 Tax=Desulfonatronum thioautotrophicum TaxID=617001 RepID=UPI000699A3EB|nr:type VI secretion system tip protein TssI/VgrG [Desulfonatronum thioautotrophicum]
MPQPRENAFTFVSQALPEDTFTVVRFNGEEGLSTLYRFDILLVSQRRNVDLTAILQNPATFTIKGAISGSADLPFHGILSAFEMMHQVGDSVFYRAELRPKLWWLTQTHHNQVFLGKTNEEFLTAVLEDAGLTSGLDFEFRYKHKYPAWEFVCQYGESHYQFLSRWLERNGVYYWFDQGGVSEKMIASDTLIAHTSLPGHETFRYSPPSGLDADETGRVVKRFTLKQSPMPKSILVRDYSYMKPSLPLEGKARVQDGGRGDIYFYGEHFLDNAEGDRLAGIRADEYHCREKVFHGLSSIPAVRPGYTFELERHFHEAFNTKYLTTMVRHEGSQERYLLGGLGGGEQGVKDELFYRNTFACIPADIQYRPPRITAKPRMAGSLSAKIDAAGSGKYAELDRYGRYKVILPFDLSGRRDGKASAWLRMATPYAGADHGMHFPLLKGTEVLIGFIDGDPDRPIIQAAVPNQETPNVVTEGNAPHNALRTAGGSEMVFSDIRGSQAIGVALPAGAARLVMTNADDEDASQTAGDGDGEGETGEQSKKKSTVEIWGDSIRNVALENKVENTIGQAFSFFGGIKNDVSVGVKGSVDASLAWGASLTTKFDYDRGERVGFGTDGYSLDDNKALVGTDQVTLRGGANFATRGALRKLKTAFGLTCAASVGGAVAASASIKENDQFSGLTKGQKWGLAGTGIGFAAVWAGITALTRSAIAALKASDLTGYAANIKLGDAGVNIDVKNGVNPGAGFEAKVGLVPPQQSSIAISSGGNSVRLNNKSTASLSLNNGQTVSATTPGGRLTLSPAKATVQYAQNSLRAAADGTDIVGGTAKLRLDPGKALLSAPGGSSSLLLNPGGIKLKFPLLNAGALKVTSTGMISLG